MGVKEWSLIDRPVGPQYIPEWCKGVHIDWQEQFASWPRVILKCHEDVGDWPEKRWVKNGKAYSTQHPDGRCCVHYHDGAVSMKPIRHYVGDKWVEQQMLATTKQEGYSGRAFVIKMQDGEFLALQGPWHGSPLPGTVDVTVTNLQKYTPYKKGPWHKALGMFGVNITDDLYIRILSKFCPHVELARVTYDFGFSQIEPIKPEEGMPHSAYYEQRRLPIKRGNLLHA